jgi:hypothetical protein
MRETLRIMLSLRPDVIDVLDRTARTNRRSAYLSALVMEHHRAWRDALHYLKMHGWSHLDLVTVTQALTSVPLAAAQSVIAEELEGADLGHFGACVRRSGDTAMALVILAMEMRLGNEELRHRIMSDV